MRISKRLLHLLLIVAGLAVLASPARLLAQEEKVDLTLRLLPGHYYREITPGEEDTLYLEIRNTGDKPITNIRLEADKPEKWTVVFMPDAISQLDAGSSLTIDVNVIAAPDTGRGEHTLTLLAEADQTRAVASTTLRVEDGSSFWLWVGVGTGALVLAGFVALYLRFGRE